MLSFVLACIDASKFCEGAYLAKTCTQCNPHDDIIDQATTATSKKGLRDLRVHADCPDDGDHAVAHVGLRTFRHPNVQTFRHPKQVGAASHGWCCMHEGERCKAETLFELHKLPAIINWGIERAGRQCTCTISHATKAMRESAGNNGRQSAAIWGNLCDRSDPQMKKP